MPGAGTKQAITTSNAPPARCLDVTRLIRRAGRVMTGVDRVEYAYLNRLIDEATPFFALARTRIGYVLLDRDGARIICEKIAGDDWGALDALGRLAPQVPEWRRRAEADLRRHAIARCLPIRLPKMLKRHVPKGCVYLNTGHSNLTNRVIGAWRHLGDAKIAVLVHDTIPLDHPEYQRPETAKAFRGFLTRVSRAADLVIYNSRQSRHDAERHMETMGRIPEAVVALLGVDIPFATPDQLPPDMPCEEPYFVCVGTIEPRKNHALLLDVWEHLLASDGCVPHLLICGARGWENEAVFRRLDHKARWRGRVHECPSLSDGAIAALLQQSNGALFPSLAEGFGLPPAEAAAMGTPVICCDLPVYRDILGDIPIYLKASDPYSWANKIKEMAEQRPPHKDYQPPDWDRHFNLVLNRV